MPSRLLDRQFFITYGVGCLTIFGICAQNRDQVKKHHIQDKIIDRISAGFRSHIGRVSNKICDVRGGICLSCPPSHGTCRASKIDLRVRLLKGLIAYPVDKATVTICITTKCLKR